MLLSTVLLWALNITVTRYVVSNGFHPLAYATIRYAAAILLFWAFTWWRERSFRIARADMKLILLAALFIFTNQIVFVTSVHLTSASTVGLVLGTTPIFVGIIATLVGLERLGSAFWIAAAVSFAGVGLIAAGASGGLSGSLLGDGLAVATAATWAAYSVTVAPLMKSYSPFRISSLVLAIGWVPLAFVSIPQIALAEHRRVRLDDGVRVRLRGRRAALPHEPPLVHGDRSRRPVSGGALCEPGAVLRRAVRRAAPLRAPDRLGDRRRGGNRARDPDRAARPAGGRAARRARRVGDNPRVSIQRRTALVSVGAAVGLVVLKLTVGLTAHSLGLVSEAVHSGTDLVAALLTFFALGVSGRPADLSHQYGHGKAEHLAALAEASFLSLASVFIAFRAIEQLVGSHPSRVVTSPYVFVTILVVIAVDATRAVTSWRVSRRTGSAALAANAVHFAGDLAGSVAVLVGLLFVRAGHPDGDPVAALFVAVLVLTGAARLIRVNVDVLMDRAPLGAEETAREAIAELGPAVELRRLRMRQAGGRQFADVVIGVAASAGVGQGHAAADAVEEALQRALPGSDVVVHVEPGSEADIRELVHVAAAAVPVGARDPQRQPGRGGRAQRALAAREASRWDDPGRGS